MTKKTAGDSTRAKTAADVQAELDQLQAKAPGLDDALTAAAAKVEALESELRDATFERDVRGAAGAPALVEQVDAELAAAIKAHRAALFTAEKFEATVTELEAERDRLVAVEQQAVFDAELKTLEVLSARLDDEIMPAFVKTCHEWTAQVAKVTSLGGLPASRRPETMVAEAAYLHFRSLMPELFRSAVSVPSKARGFRDWALRCRNRAAGSMREVERAG